MGGISKDINMGSDYSTSKFYCSSKWSRCILWTKSSAKLPIPLNFLHWYLVERYFTGYIWQTKCSVSRDDFRDFAKEIREELQRDREERLHTAHLNPPLSPPPGPQAQAFMPFPVLPKRTTGNPKRRTPTALQLARMIHTHLATLIPRKAQIVPLVHPEDVHL
ncbi:hypothetical protein B0H17DRAFT_1147406 [Mycena rosella]|uniref:Uncharacterized protein n=1 Tax=Mycena rosella TaxID=1033263 RepID=A0AAD7CLU2_MYCRO|nr:hypothetical protein B0H17DRAFT_1147406 [Mycena rosella]